MILDSLQRHAAIITDYEVLRFNLVGDSYQLICQVDLSDGSILHVRDYPFLDGVRKYSFHWQTATDECILRWHNLNGGWELFVATTGHNFALLVLRRQRQV